MRDCAALGNVNDRLATNPREVLWMEITVVKLEYASESRAKLIKIKITGTFLVVQW